MDFYTASSLKQSTGRNVNPLGHIIPILIQEMCALRRSSKYRVSPDQDSGPREMSMLTITPQMTSNQRTENTIAKKNYKQWSTKLKIEQHKPH